MPPVTRVIVPAIVPGTITVNGEPLLDVADTVTTTLPVVAPAGTGVTMLVLLHVPGAAAVPLNVTLLVPCVAPKLVPVMVTLSPAAAAVGERLLIVGGGTNTVNAVPALGTPDTVTTTGPVVAPAGTWVTIFVAIQLVMVVTVVPLNLTVLAPCEAPKLVPLMVTLAPTRPELGTRLVIVGVGSTVNAAPGLV